MSHLTDAAAHLDNALEHHAAKRYGAVKSSIKSAQSCIERAIDEAAPVAHDPTVNPTAAQGAQTSNGQSPRSFDPEVRRQQDQIQSCQIAYDVRMGFRR